MALVLGENMFASEMQFLPMHGWLDEDCFNTEASTESEEELTKRADQTASVHGPFLTVNPIIVVFSPSSPQ